METLEKYDHVEISKVEGEATPIYNIVEPKYTAKELEVLKDWKKIVSQSEIQLIHGEPDISLRWQTLKDRVLSALPDAPNKDIVARKIVGMAFGYGDIGLLIDDDNLEEVMVNGITLPVFVFHRKHGMCKTKIVFKATADINQMIHNLCFINNKEIKPIVDIATMDGNRLNITGCTRTR